MGNVLGGGELSGRRKCLADMSEGKCPGEKCPFEVLKTILVQATLRYSLPKIL